MENMQQDKTQCNNSIFYSFTQVLGIDANVTEHISQNMRYTKTADMRTIAAAAAAATAAITTTMETDAGNTGSEEQRMCKNTRGADDQTAAADHRNSNMMMWCCCPNITRIWHTFFLFKVLAKMCNVNTNTIIHNYKYQFHNSGAEIVICWWPVVLWIVGIFAVHVCFVYAVVVFCFAPSHLFIVI